MNCQKFWKLLIVQNVKKTVFYVFKFECYKFDSFEVCSKTDPASLKYKCGNGCSQVCGAKFRRNKTGEEVKYLLSRKCIF